MVNFRHILLASVATVAVASPTSAPGSNHGPGMTGLGHHSEPHGPAPTGVNSHHHGTWSHDGQGQGNHEHFNTDKDKHTKHQARSWQRPTGAPIDMTHGPKPSGGPDGGAGSHHQGDWQHGGPGSRVEEPHTKPTGTGSNGHGKHQARDSQQHTGNAGGMGQWTKPSGAPAAAEGGPQAHGGQHLPSDGSHMPHAGSDGNTGGHNQHQPREEAGESRHEGYITDGEPNHHGNKFAELLEGLGSHHHVEVRNTPSHIDIPDNDPGLMALRAVHASGKRSVDDGDRSAIWNQTNYQGYHHLDARKAPVYGIYECMNPAFVAPCRWTQITSETQCYNAYYGNRGSMGPDHGMCCKIYEQKKCNQDHWQTINGFKWPGIKFYGQSDLLLNSGIADDGIGSLMCKFQDEKTCLAKGH